MTADPRAWRAPSDPRGGDVDAGRCEPRAPIGTEPLQSRISVEQIDELSRQLRIAVELDSAGWLRDGIELRYTLGPGQSLQLAAVRVARTATVDELLAQGGVVERCARYNRAIGALHALRDRVDAVIGRGHASLDPDAPGAAVVRAHQELARLDDTIARRRAVRMGHGVTTLETLGFEIEFFERYLSHLAALAAYAETAEKSALGDGDTLDLEPDPAPDRASQDAS
jgi:hypothetical protein